MKKIFTLCILLAFVRLFGQTNEDSIKIDSLSFELQEIKTVLSLAQDQLKSFEKRYRVFSVALDDQNEKQDQVIDSLQNLISANSLGLKEADMRLGSQIKETEKQVDSDISVLESELSKNTLYWILASCFAVLLALILFVLLRRMLLSRTNKTAKQLEATRQALQEENIKLDNKLLELLEKQLSAQKIKAETSVSRDQEIDHSLALKVADEIVKIQKNLTHMDDATRGKKQLNASVERIRANFEANGYEIVDMLNMPYHEGMKVQANFRTDENLEEGRQIITRIIKPQVNFKQIMIQSAQIEVSQNI